MVVNAGKMQYNLKEFDFGEVLKEATDSVQEIYPARQFIIEETVAVTINADRHRI